MDKAASGKDGGVIALTSALLCCWVVNWIVWKSWGSPLPYCWIKSWLGPTLAQLHDGLRACLFVVVLGVIAVNRGRALVWALGALAFNLMLPGFLETLFSFGQACR